MEIRHQGTQVGTGKVPRYLSGKRILPSRKGYAASLELRKRGGNTRKKLLRKGDVTRVSHREGPARETHQTEGIWLGADYLGRHNPLEVVSRKARSSQKAKQNIVRGLGAIFLSKKNCLQMSHQKLERSFRKCIKITNIIT